MQLFFCFIPNFEIRITPLRDIMQVDYTTMLGDLWNQEAKVAFDEMRQAIHDPCLQCYDHRKIFVLWTDFSSEGFGYLPVTVNQLMTMPPFKGCVNACKVALSTL
jgi:hypothetical protein